MLENLKLAVLWLLLSLGKLKQSLRGDVSIAGAVGAFIGAVVIIIAGVNLIPVVADEVDTVIFQNASDWNFTGNAGASAILGLVPFVFIAGILLASVGMTLYYFSKKAGS